MYTESNQTYKKKLEKKLIQMELGFSKDGKLETFKDRDEFHVQIFLLSLSAVTWKSMLLFIPV